MRIFGGIAKVAVPDIGEMSDAELLSAHVGGDRAAFEALISRHRDRLWQVAKRTSYSDEDAADAMQDAMLSAHRMAATYRNDAAVRSWLHSIVVNACLDRIRRNRVRPSAARYPDGVEQIRDEHNRISDLEITLDVQAALFALPPEQRAAVVAVDVEGYSVKEAARRLGVPEGTIKSRCARGRKKLAFVLDDLRFRGNRS
ncbi:MULTISPECIES: RNA polymerase sigma factor SigM [unclassified Rhodococcus (in: high G+C Gram-positive bacteria)]|uniref:RNA polymerase sigma factor SigM n=1 Tax=Rhodococcus sp. SJ-3 TaxID=3454628 RepID=UPI003F791DE1